MPFLEDDDEDALLPPSTPEPQHKAKQAVSEEEKKATEEQKKAALVSRALSNEIREAALKRRYQGQGPATNQPGASVEIEDDETPIAVTDKGKKPIRPQGGTSSATQMSLYPSSMALCIC